MHLTSSPHRGRVVRPGVSAAVALLLLASCSGQEPRHQEADPLKATYSANSAQGAPLTVALATAPGVRSGTLHSAEHTKIAQVVAGLVDEWFASAYLSGPWPRADFTDVWPHFTPRLKKRAYAERATTSNAAIAARIDGIRVLARAVTVDVLGVSNQVAGATARVELEFVTSGQVRQKVRVAGQLHLTPGRSGWTIFAYDLTRTVAELGPVGHAGATPGGGR